MRAASLKPIALCALGAVLGGASMQLLLQSNLVAGSRAPGAIVGGRSAEAGRLDAPRAFAPQDGAEAAADRAGTAIEPGAGTGASASRASAADTIVDLAATNPGAAMDRALAIEAYWLRRDTMLRVAAVWAEQAPREALGFVQAARELDPGIRSSLRSRVLEVWAVTDPARALVHLLGRDGQDMFFFDARAGRQFARELAALQPHELLYAANGLPNGLMRSELREHAIASLVEQDLEFALREAGLAAPGLERRQWVTAIGRVDPDRAAELERGWERNWGQTP